MRAPPENENPAPSVNGCRAQKKDQAANQINSQNNNTLGQGQGAIDSLVRVHRSWGIPADELILGLLDRGVSEQAMTRPYCIGGGRVVYHRQSFETDLNGKPVITFRAEYRGEVTDLVAWDPVTGLLASWRGQAFCLGDVDNVLNTATYFDGCALWVHETPLEWLLAERRGVVILRPELCSAYLAHAPRLAVPTFDFALKVKRWLQPPEPTAALYVRAPA
jgi:hypothetical protein